MILYGKVINEMTELCEVGVGTNIEFYKSIGYVELDVKQSDIDNNYYLTDKCPMKSEEEKVEERKAQFHKDFFNTSLGFVRRKVSMATGETKDFLSDLLPAITSAVQIGQEVKILTYKEPDYTTDEVDWTKLQEIKIVTPQFVNECVLQLNNDFLPQIEPTVPTEPTK